jgi:hypothetical protein
MAVGLLGMPVAVLAVLVSRRRVLLGLFVLPVGVMMGCLQMMVCGSVMVCGSLPMVFDGRVFGLLCHGGVLRQGSWGEGRIAPEIRMRSDC